MVQDITMEVFKLLKVKCKNFSLEVDLYKRGSKILPIEVKENLPLTKLTSITSGRIETPASFIIRFSSNSSFVAGFRKLTVLPKQLKYQVELEVLNVSILLVFLLDLVAKRNLNVKVYYQKDIKVYYWRRYKVPWLHISRLAMVGFIKRSKRKPTRTNQKLTEPLLNHPTIDMIDHICHEGRLSPRLLNNKTSSH